MSGEVRARWDEDESVRCQTNTWVASVSKVIAEQRVASDGPSHHTVRSYQMAHRIQQCGTLDSASHSNCAAYGIRSESGGESEMGTKMRAKVRNECVGCVRIKGHCQAARCNRIEHRIASQLSSAPHRI